MHDLQMIATGTAIAVALASLFSLLLQRSKRPAEIAFAVVSGSMALSLLLPWLHHAPTWSLWLVAIGGSATCNGFWLVSRGVFRGEGGFGKVHVWVAAGVAGMIAIYRGVATDAAGEVATWATGLNGLLTLASSALLVLTFLEALRGDWKTLPKQERQLRLAFMCVFAGCVVSTTLSGSMQTSMPLLGEIRGVLIPVCAAVMILFTHAVLWHRRSHTPLETHKSESKFDPTYVLGQEEQRLANALEHQLVRMQVFREPELKVAELAQRLSVPEHKLSRLISRGLGETNFNQLLNRHRIGYACARLADANDDASILEISGDAGFASLGPFNRAFKALTGTTPSRFRALHRGVELHETTASM